MRQLGKAVWSEPNTERELGDRRRGRWANAWAVLGIVLAVAGLAFILVTLAGCQASPCAGHGGVRYWSGSWDYCNDGSVQPA